MTSFGSYSQEGGTGMRNYEMRFYGFKKSENEDYGDIFLSAKSENSSLNRSERVVFFPLAYPTKNCLYYRLLSPSLSSFTGRDWDWSIRKGSSPPHDLGGVDQKGFKPAFLSLPLPLSCLPHSLCRENRVKGLIKR